MAFWKIVGLLVSPRMPALDERGQLAAGDVAALEVVEPRALALLVVQVGETIHGVTPSFAASAVARATTLATLMPSLSSTGRPGALAPKRSMPMTSSAQRAHPNVTAGLDRQHRHAGGQHRRRGTRPAAPRSDPTTGMLTTRARRPAAASSAAASTHRLTSLPVASSTTCGASVSTHHAGAAWRRRSRRCTR